MDFDALERDLVRAIAAQRAPLRRLKLVGVTAVGCLVLVGTAGAGARLLGWSAPPHVQHDIQAVDQGLPADLALNPDASHARAVAQDGDSTLYSADLRDGGYCSEIVTANGRARGATCLTKADVYAHGIEITLPSDDSVAADSPITLAGRINAAGATSLELQYGSGPTDFVPLGDDRFFIYNVPADRLAAAHGVDLHLTARSTNGKARAHVTVPADWAGPAAPDTRAPIFVSTRSDESDLTKVYGLEGHVGAAGATSLELRYRDGLTIAIPIASDGSYSLRIPAARTGSFMQPQLLVALDAAGRELASAPVAAVAYWTAKERHR